MKSKWKDLYSSLIQYFKYDVVISFAWIIPLFFSVQRRLYLPLILFAFHFMNAIVISYFLSLHTNRLAYTLEQKINILHLNIFCGKRIFSLNTKANTTWNTIIPLFIMYCIKTHILRYLDSREKFRLYLFNSGC